MNQNISTRRAFYKQMHQVWTFSYCLCWELHSEHRTTLYWSLSSCALCCCHVGTEIFFVKRAQGKGWNLHQVWTSGMRRGGLMEEMMAAFWSLTGLTWMRINMIVEERVEGVAGPHNCLDLGDRRPHLSFWPMMRPKNSDPVYSHAFWLIYRLNLVKGHHCIKFGTKAFLRWIGESTTRLKYNWYCSMLIWSFSEVYSCSLYTIYWSW